MMLREVRFICRRGGELGEGKAGTECNASCAVKVTLLARLWMGGAAKYRGRMNWLVLKLCFLGHTPFVVLRGKESWIKERVETLCHGRCSFNFMLLAFVD